MAVNYYLLLGVPPDAEQQQIKTAYRHLAKRFHPDTNQGSEAAADLFRQVNEAYRILGDPRTREKYDRSLPSKPPAAETEKNSPKNSDEKIQHFFSSLLDAIFGSLEPTPARPALRAASAVPPKPAARKKRSPDFNFYFQLALERENTPYRREEDGIFRTSPKAAKASGPAARRSRTVFSSLLLSLLTTLFALIQP